MGEGVEGGRERGEKGGEEGRKGERKWSKGAREQGSEGFRFKICCNFLCSGENLGLMLFHLQPILAIPNTEYLPFYQQ